jgi:hypothetical protein
MGAIKPCEFRASFSCRETTQLSARRGNDLILSRRHPNRPWPLPTLDEEFPPTEDLPADPVDLWRWDSGSTPNVLSDVVRHQHGWIADRIAEVVEQHVSTSIIVAAEPR